MTSLTHSLIAASILALSASAFAADNNMDMPKDAMMDKSTTTMSQDAKDMNMSKDAMPAKDHMEKKPMAPKKHMAKKSMEMKDSMSNDSMGKDAMGK